MAWATEKMAWATATMPATMAWVMEKMPGATAAMRWATATMAPEEATVMQQRERGVGQVTVKQWLCWLYRSQGDSLVEHRSRRSQHIDHI